jgi:small conductance mechanosensitive channel
MTADLSKLPTAVPVMKSQLAELYASTQAILLPAALKVLAAIAIWIVGGFVIRAVLAAIERAMRLQQVDATLVRYMRSFLGVLLRLGLVLGILGFLGFETTSFAALLAAAGIAIGTAWSGLLSNFAAGVFLVVLRPFKVGDSIQIAGVTGNVREIGLFGTSLDTPDGVRVLIGNQRVFNDNIINYSANPLRRVDLRVQLAHGAEVMTIMETLRGAIVDIEHVAKSPAAVVEIIDISPIGPVLGVRPYVANEHYAQVFFEGQRLIARLVDSKDLPCTDPRGVATPPL